MTPRTKNIAAILLAWTIAGVLYSIQSFLYRKQVGQDVDFSSMLLIDTPFFLFWAIFTPLLIYLSRRFPLTATPWGQLLLLHGTVGSIVSFLHALLYLVYRLTVAASTTTEFDFAQLFINAFATVDYGLLVYFVTLLVIGIIDYQRSFRDEQARNAELQKALAQTQLNALRSRLQPHFLFNTLNSIAVLIKENPQEANDTVHRLSDLLRYVLKTGENQFAQLDKEIAFLRKYLSIEETRFGKRLTVNIDVEANLLQNLIPALLLQPIVENAVRHGIAEKRGEVWIKIRIARQENRIHMTVSDNGNGYQPSSNGDGSGLGLSITRERLQSTYQSNFDLQIKSPEAGGTTVVLNIPIIEETGQ